MHCFDLTDLDQSEQLFLTSRDEEYGKTHISYFFNQSALLFTTYTYTHPHIMFTPTNNHISSYTTCLFFVISDGNEWIDVRKHSFSGNYQT